jgi:hypothetical protein
VTGKITLDKNDNLLKQAILFAAAPELLAALKRCVLQMEDVRDAYYDVIGTEDEPGWIEDIGRTTRIAREAIARAEGTSVLRIASAGEEENP